jgi:hypothetical protein
MKYNQGKVELRPSFHAVHEHMSSTKTPKALMSRGSVCNRTVNTLDG